MEINIAHYYYNGDRLNHPQSMLIIRLHSVNRIGEAKGTLVGAVYDLTFADNTMKS